MGKDVFENAIVDTSILITRNGKSDAAGKAVDMDRLPDKDFPPAVHLWGTFVPRDEKPWSVLSAVEPPVMDKMEILGTPLKEWDVSINYGIKTGYNAAFIIDEAIKESLIAADPKSAEIIKPVLRGRDIQRYLAKWAGLYLIIAKFGSYKNLPKQYPAVYEYLQVYENNLKARGQCRYSQTRGSNSREYPGQHHWLELDNNPRDEYLELFKKEKLFWIDLTERGRFAYDAGEIFCVNTAFMISGKAIKYLCAVLNSRLTTWFMGNTALNSGMGVTRWILHTVEEIPVPKLSAAKQRPFIRLVDRILHAKTADPTADTSAEEAEIDRLVYALYGLTPAEVAAVEGR